MNEYEEVKHPDHYGGEANIYECFKVAEAWGLDKDAYLFTVLKYICRAGKKPGQEFTKDLRKALVYLQRRVDHPI